MSEENHQPIPIWIVGHSVTGPAPDPHQSWWDQLVKVISCPLPPVPEINLNRLELETALIETIDDLYSLIKIQDQAPTQVDFEFNLIT